MSTDTQNRTFLHPVSGALILVLDWLLFSGSVLSLGLGTPALVTIGFVIGLLGVGFVQRRYDHDTLTASAFKGLLGGIAVGIPFPIAGTAVGAFILSVSGLRRWRERLRRRTHPRVEE